MIYDPDRLPFWEEQRRAGPHTRQQRTRKRARLEAELFDVEHEMVLVKADTNKRHLEDLVDERNFILAALEELKA